MDHRRSPRLCNRQMSSHSLPARQKTLLKLLEFMLFQRQSRRRHVRPPNPDHQQIRVKRIQPFQRIAHMQPLNRTAWSSLACRVARRRKGDHRAVKNALNARRQNSTNTPRPPFRMIHRQTARKFQLLRSLFAQDKRFPPASPISFARLVKAHQLAGRTRASPGCRATVTPRQRTYHPATRHSGEGWRG